jgi:hypothetical protein
MLAVAATAAAVVGAAGFIAYLLALTIAAAIFDTHAHVRLFFRVTVVTVAEAAEPGECPICLERLASERLGRLERLGRVGVGACGHAFHAACIARWFARAATCPVCRADLRAPDRRAAHGWCADASAHVDALTGIFLGS